MDYVRINCNYYETQFNKLDNTGKADFHVPAFLIGVFWLFYRKMYVEGAIFSIAVMIAVLIPYIGCFIAIGLCIALGINASKVYRLHLEKLVEEVNSLPENKRLMHIQKNGGTLF
jgi:Na+/alanine symporter